MKLVKKTYINEFVEAITAGHEMIYNACVGMVEQIDANPECKQEYIDAMPNVPQRTWATFEKIGRNMMDWRLALGGVKNEGAIKRLPVSDQNRIMDGEKLELIVSGGDTLMVDPTTCNKEQAAQLFDKGAIRTLSEQRAFLEAEERGWEMVEKVHSLTERYRVMGSRVIVPAACDFNKADLLVMLGEIK
tara:strand:- start:906 stop:1472 length:567 start_codon:yes stop_codon:yes gene_type:complete